MNPVVQQETTGCAIASSAAIAGISYNEAKATANRLGIHARDKNLWSSTGYIRTLLKELGYSIGKMEEPFKDWQSLPDCALLSIKWHIKGGKPFWHWVVFVREGEQDYVLDSKKTLKTNKRKDFRRMKPKWYIKVNT